MNFNWLVAFTEVIGTLIFIDWACRFRARELGFRFFDRNFIVLRIDLDQHGAFLHVLVVVHIHLGYVPGNTAAHGVELRIHLGIVGGFIGAQVVPQKQAAHEDNYTDSNDYEAFCGYSSACNVEAAEVSRIPC